ncbi:hypothetical protein DPM13_12360 [Paracoccus mutanolyticus]|uniref:Uncharacterized protein n=1 Tax=Paracoccus mutanolyticus TaxID=1499308 RepID=A0ABN5M9C4_9RHOB|nr:hypothetical protein DPM13_12360 [Paracoccus mutanolyticus]
MQRSMSRAHNGAENRLLLGRPIPGGGMAMEFAGMSQCRRTRNLLMRYVFCPSRDAGETLGLTLLEVAWKRST